MALVVGVTGGIGTGKSTVLGMLAKLGAVTLSADDVAREVLSKGSAAYGEAVVTFGEGILAPDGQVDRAALAKIIFDDSAARQTLNDITHPPIIAEIERRIESFRKGPPTVGAVLAVEIPLLVECGMEGAVDQVLLVAAEQETQLGRLIDRSKITDEEAFRRIEAQMPIECKLSRADRVIWNDGTLESLEESVRRYWDQIHLP